MSKLSRWMHECITSHLENRDHEGAEAIDYALRTSRKKAVAAYPDQIDAIDNALAYAKQELASASA